jgi:hypothetical protein
VQVIVSFGHSHLLCGLTVRRVAPPAHAARGVVVVGVEVVTVVTGGGGVGGPPGEGVAVVGGGGEAVVVPPPPSTMVRRTTSSKGCRMPAVGKSECVENLQTITSVCFPGCMPLRVSCFSDIHSMLCRKCRSGLEERSIAVSAEKVASVRVQCSVSRGCTCRRCKQNQYSRYVGGGEGGRGCQVTERFLVGTPQ